MVVRAWFLIFMSCFAFQLFSMDDSIFSSGDDLQMFMDLVRMCNDMFSVSFAHPTLSENDIFLIEGKKSQAKGIPEWAEKPKDFARKLALCFDKKIYLLKIEKEEQKRTLAQRLAKLNYNLQKPKEIDGDMQNLLSSFCIIEEEDDLLANHVARLSKELKIGERVELTLLWTERCIVNIQNPQKKIYTCRAERKFIQNGMLSLVRGIDRKSLSCNSEKLAAMVTNRVAEISKSFLLIDQRQRDELKKKLRILHEKITKQFQPKENEKLGILDTNKKIGELLCSFEKL